MQLPLEIPPELKKYESYLSEETFLHEIEKNPKELLSFFLHACEDETWTESNSTIMKSLLKWLTDATLQRNFPSDFFSPIIPVIHKHISILYPWIPLNLRLETVSGDLDVNSLLLGHYSYYFRRRMTNECRGLKHPVLEVKELSLEVLRWINEFIMAGEIKDLWKFRPAEIWILIDSAEFISIYPLLEVCESILTRYIERKNVCEILQKAHEKFLQHLQNACIEFINNLEGGIHLRITPVEFLAFEFLDYKDWAFEFFDKLHPIITHLIFSSDLAKDSHFQEVIHRCPKLMGLDLSDSTLDNEQLKNLPENLREIHLARCRWITPETVILLSSICLEMIHLDLSGNDQFSHSVWAELQRFKRVEILDVSRCYQIGDNELKMILQSLPKLIELKLMDCKKISQEGFFEIGKLLPKLSRLNISRSVISDAALIDVMSRCQNLYELDISRCYNLSAKGIQEGIRNCPGLLRINLRNTELTLDEVYQIQKSYPYLRIQ